MQPGRASRGRGTEMLHVANPDLRASLGGLADLGPARRSHRGDERREPPTVRRPDHAGLQRQRQPGPDGALANRVATRAEAGVEGAVVGVTLLARVRHILLVPPLPPCLPTLLPPLDPAE
jgi:hypothetical protein